MLLAMFYFREIYVFHTHVHPMHYVGQSLTHQHIEAVNSYLCGICLRKWTVWMLIIWRWVHCTDIIVYLVQVRIAYAYWGLQRSLSGNHVLKYTICDQRELFNDVCTSTNFHAVDEVLSRHSTPRKWYDKAEKIPRPSHNALLPIGYFVQVWVISDERHLSAF